jgi:TonB family protein
MKGRQCEVFSRAVGAVCLAGAIMATMLVDADAQGQASSGQQAAGNGTQPLTLRFLSPAHLPPTRPSSMDITYSSKHPPKYPREAIRAHHQSMVVVLARIGLDGQVTGARVEQSSGYPELDEVAASTVTVWKFFPAYKDGVPVVSWCRVPMEFSLPKTPGTH